MRGRGGALLSAIVSFSRAVNAGRRRRSMQRCGTCPLSCHRLPVDILCVATRRGDSGLLAPNVATHGPDTRCTLAELTRV